MKKKIALIMAAILCLSMLLASCGKKKDEPSFNSIVNADWAGLDDDSISVLSTKGEALEIKGAITDSNDGYFVTEEYSNQNGESIYTQYVYDLATAKLLLTLTNSSKDLPQAEGEDFNRTQIVEYYVDLIDKDNFAVLTIAYDLVDDLSAQIYYHNNNFNTDNYFGYESFPGSRVEENIANNCDIKINMNHHIKVYEKASETPVETLTWKQIKDWTAPYYGDSFADNYEDRVRDNYLDEEDENTSSLGHNLVVKGTKVYRVDEDGNETLVKDFGASALPSQIYFETEEYYVTYKNSAYTYYDKDLEEQFIYVLPEYPEYEGFSYESKGCVLNNGNLLVQYYKGLEADEKKYDFHVPTIFGEARYDIVTLIVNPKTGEETELDVEFMIVGVDTAYSAETDRMCWADGVENIVYATYIDDDKLVRDDAAAVDWISMTNEGEVKGSVKFDSSLISAPKAYCGNYLAATNINGDMVIFTADGKVVNTIREVFNASSRVDIVEDKYILTYDYDYNSNSLELRVLYDIAGNKLYDFEEKKAEIINDTTDYNAFVTRYYNKGVETYDVVFEGQVVETFTVGDDEEVYIDDQMYMRIKKTGVDENSNDIYEYSLYNAKGELMLKSDSYIYIAVGNEDFVIVRTSVKDETTKESKVKFFRFNMIED